jgi:hypothetical protein
MMRRSVVVGCVALLASSCVLASATSATVGVKATLTHAVQPGPPGTRVAIAWKLHDASGRAVLDTHVFVKITCPEGDRSTTMYANPDGHGVYVARALVPPGGVGSITVGHGGSVFPVTNPYHA